MPVTGGSRFGSYEIHSLLGAGGMGEVYRAHDAKLGRAVAIKLLPEAWALDPERLARFEREARVLASLNHPHIAALYGFEHADGRHLLVMELVEGETLADRLARGPMPVDEALDVARQIAEALESAHADSGRRELGGGVGRAEVTERLRERDHTEARSNGGVVFPRSPISQAFSVRA